MDGVTVRCMSCSAPIEVHAFSTFIHCPYCGTNNPFPGFTYKHVNWKASMFAHVKLWTGCPVCRSPNMYLGPEKHNWRCPDCGYTLSRRDKRKSVFWFCDNCETYLNVQDGFSTKTGTWLCRNCGFINDVTNDNID